MGRPESQLSGTDPEVVKFADDLRQLRREAGSPSYRRMAAQAHYSASSLSQAANGRAIPSLAVTLGFVRACGGDADEWEQRWRQLSGPAVEEPPTPPPARRKISRWAWATAAGIAAAAVATYLVIVPAGPHKSAASAQAIAGQTGNAQTGNAQTGNAQTGNGQSGNGQGSTGQGSTGQGSNGQAVAGQTTGQTDPVADGSDPTRAGCGPGAVTLASTRVHFPTDQLSGLVELRYSPQCHMAWGRFSPDSKWHPGPNTMVTVWTIRPADQATQSYTVEFGGESIIGNMLRTSGGCVAAEVSMARGPVNSPIATTGCQLID
jgi:hypothetical protein